LTLDSTCQNHCAAVLVTPHPSRAICAFAVHSTRSTNFKLRHYPSLLELARVGLRLRERRLDYVEWTREVARGLTGVSELVVDDEVCLRSLPWSKVWETILKHLETRAI
jgi:hypothetical protein